MKSSATPRIVGPGFHQKVYDAVRQVPPGRVTTYGDVGTYLGSPTVARHVGWALASLVDSNSSVPWHRVINAQGRISFKGQSYRAALQRQLLEQDGVTFSDSDRIDLNQYRWFWD